MKQKLIITALAICMISMSTLAANANQWGRGGYGEQASSEKECGENERRGKHSKFRQEMVNELLGFTDEQQEQIKAIRAEERASSKTLREEMRDHRDQIHQITNSGTFNESAIRAIAEEKAEMQVEMVVAKARMHSRINDIMTPEQRELSTKIRSLRHKNRGKSRHGEKGWQSNLK